MPLNWIHPPILYKPTKLNLSAKMIDYMHHNVKKCWLKYFILIYSVLLEFSFSVFKNNLLKNMHNSVISSKTLLGTSRRIPRGSSCINKICESCLLIH